MANRGDKSNRSSTVPHRGRRGVAALDYILVLGVVLPLVAVFVIFAPRGMSAVYEMICGLVSWPFM